jgi:hypothetical protein
VGFDASGRNRNGKSNTPKDSPKSHIIRYLEKGFNFSLSSSSERSGDNLPTQLVTALRNTPFSKNTEIL